MITASEELKKSVIYQLYLRAFTKEGTLKAAEEMLDTVKDTGADIVYLASIAQHDDDMDKNFWSVRQVKSEMNNPKNPYRVKDYFKIDEEYGTDDDLKSFVNKAHSLGLKVFLDLVYYHCGPKANLLDMDPDFIKRDEDGKPFVGDWKFPILNYESEKLREYMYSNMEYYVKEFNIDGYRIDIGDYVTLDFWEEGRKRLEKIKPDILMLNEGHNPEYLKNAFEIQYDSNWTHLIGPVFKGEKPASEIPALWKKSSAEENGRSLRSFENHDISNDAYENRLEVTPGFDGVNALHVLNFTMDGIPFIYNGNEIADSNRHSIYSNRFYGKNEFINWRKALTEYGIKRKNLVQELCKIRKSTPELYSGSLEWIENTAPDKVVSFMRGEKILVIINTSNEFIETEIENSGEFKSLLNSKAVYSSDNKKLKASLLPYGYLVLSL